MTRFTTISSKQKEFQRQVGFPVDSVLASDRNEMSEKYLFKAIEEIVELRKEFPSVMNPWAKTQKDENLDDIKSELSDVFLFLINFMNAWGISEDELHDAIETKQTINYNSIKRKKLKLLYDEMSEYAMIDIINTNNEVSPAEIYIASVSEQLHFVDKSTVKDDDYLVAIVKRPVAKDETVSDGEILKWKDFLDKEIEILKINNEDLVINYL
jgi:NTP pyrophosphatase (non-canonical NTP hydrolase)